MLHQDLVESDKPESWDLFLFKFISNIVSDSFTLTRKNGSEVVTTLVDMTLWIIIKRG
ncbi:hypothetical protein ARMGADRAFT_1019865 [Armillaria gallica]|uniref:Uncharacterized protein n=1 Tax=Armillaria gallica TaxID=47427 RepID=A0A2H3CL94_ARMGA|nr:hypothetical protein ARMGADRAFT_1019865 [Armillaria gallica]